MRSVFLKNDTKSLLGEKNLIFSLLCHLCSFPVTASVEL